MKISNWINENKLLMTILVIGAFFRFYHIDFQSVWLDEIHTLNESNPNISIFDVYEKLLISEPHPPLYFIIIHFAFKVFGYTTFVLRFLSSLIGVFGIFSIYLLGKEIFSKRVGTYASILLSINYFHIYYSQEGRMYVLLFLTTTLSFLFLVKFIKKPSFKTALIYSCFSSLMIYSHFFGLFALISQYLILLYFVIKPNEVSGRKFFNYCLSSGIITTILFLPTYSLFKKTAEIKSIWIKMPTIDVYTQIIKDFFGQSELVLFVVVLLLILFFIQLFKQKNTKAYLINPTEDKLVFGFFILFVWITVTLILPLIRTYTSLPMLVNRYFINILPAIIIITAVGLNYIKNDLVKHLTLLLIVFFSLTDIIIVKKYYNSTNKTQFREATNYIAKNNKSNENIVSSLGWYLPYFLNNDEIKNNIIEQNLDNYISEMLSDKNKIKSFWYFDGHIRPYNPSESTKEFVEQNFIIDKSIVLYDCYAKHFILKQEANKSIDLKKYKELKKVNGTAFNFNIETFSIENNILRTTGWAFFDKQSAEKTEIVLFLINNNEKEMLHTDRINRKDVSEYFKNKFNLENSGFASTIRTNSLDKGNYQLAIYLINHETKKEGLMLTEKSFQKD